MQIRRMERHARRLTAASLSDPSVVQQVAQNRSVINFVSYITDVYSEKIGMLTRQNILFQVTCILSRTDLILKLVKVDFAFVAWHSPRKLELGEQLQFYPQTL